MRGDREASVMTVTHQKLVIIRRMRDLRDNHLIAFSVFGEIDETTGV